MMDCKEGTVKKYLFDAVRKIREQLKDYSHNGV
jgi:DNA-directed RNA polymerase specialized sigma24 family protein